MNWTISRVRLNGQGYDSSGRYWGTGLPLFEIETNGWTEGFWSTTFILSAVPELLGQSTNLASFGFLNVRAANNAAVRTMIRKIDHSAKFKWHLP